MFLDIWTPMAPVRERLVLPTRILNLIALLGVFVVNTLATTLPINGKSTGEISDMYFTYITPAGYAFSIWGLIYFALACFGIYQVLPASYNSRPINEGIGYIFIINCLLNMGWILAWHYLQMWLAVILMLGILGTLGIIYYRLSAYFEPASTNKEWFLVHFGFSLYLAWIIGATIINLYCATTTTDAKYVPAAITGLVFALLIEGCLGLLRLDAVLPAVGCWATVAIAKNAQSGKAANDQVYTAAVFVAVVLALEAVGIMAYNLWLLTRGERLGWDKRQLASASASVEGGEVYRHLA